MIGHYTIRTISGIRFNGFLAFKPFVKGQEFEKKQIFTKLTKSVGVIHNVQYESQE